MENIKTQILNQIEASSNILLMPSSPVDGDSLGSSLALYLALKKLDKHVTVVCADPIPDTYKFLPMMSAIESEFSPTPDFIVTVDLNNTKLDSIQSELEHDKVNIILSAKSGQFEERDVSFSHGPTKYDLIITVDTASPQQLGRFYEDNLSLFSQIPVINIDHHASNERFGRINYVDIMSSSTTEMILVLLEKIEENTGKKLIDEDIATLLLAGVITDTGSFQNSNTTPKSFASAAKLIRYGARQQEIIQHIFKTKQLSTLRLWGRILTHITTEESHNFVWSYITRKDLQETESRDDETGGIVDELLTNAPNTNVVLLLKEKEDNILSGSIRTTNDQIDASAIAELFNGGGHTRAAGFKIKDATFKSHGHKIIESIKSYISPSSLPETPQTLPQLQPKTVVKTVINQENKSSKHAETKQSLENGVKYKFEN